VKNESSSSTRISPTQRRHFKAKLAEAGTSLVSVARERGWDYQRLQRVLGGYVAPRPGEIEQLLEQVIAGNKRPLPDRASGGEDDLG